MRKRTSGHFAGALEPWDGLFDPLGQAPAVWVLADAEDNEACVTTWQGRDG